jgi:cell division protein FtsW (lipid II flippase)
VSAETLTPSPSTRRGVELGLLVFALGLVSAAYTAVGLARTGAVPADLAASAAGLAVLFGAAHVVVRLVAPYADPVLLPVAALLNGLGLVLIHRLDLAAAERARALGRAAPRTDASLQLVWTAVGVALFVLVLVTVREHRRLQRYTYTAMLAGLGLLALPAVLPASISEVNGARIWIRLAGFSIQPGEFAKLALMVFFAGYLVTKRDVLALASRRVLGLDLPRGRDLGPVLVAWLASLGVLILERDLGSSLLFFGIFVVMLYIATERWSWLLIGVLLFVSGAAVAARLFPHVQARVAIWLDPFADASGNGYQLAQALIGLATGGLLGTGLGQGRPEIVPFAKTDFIVATVGEELGLAGLMALLLLYLLVVERGLRTALAVRDPFGKLLAAGLAVALALQVFVVAGGVTRLIPLTGLTMPFLSYGGSSLVANWALVALLLRISDAARRPPPVVRPAPDEAATQVVGVR